MTTLREAAQQALDALEYILPDTPDQRMKKDAAITALRTTLAEPCRHADQCNEEGWCTNGCEGRTALAEQPAPNIGEEWQPCVKLPVVVHVRKQRAGETHVSTREGITPVRPDDLIMRGVAGEEYPIGRELFERTYRLGDKLAEQPAPQVLTDAEIDAAFSRAVGSSLPIHIAAVRAILARAIPPGHVVVPAAEIEALRKERDEMDILATYSRNDGRREWVNVGTWLHHGEVVVHMAARPGGEG